MSSIHLITITSHPPDGHSVLWSAVASGVVSVPDELRYGDLVVFEPSNDALEFEAVTDSEFVIGSTVLHDYDLFTGFHSVHTNPEALRDGENRIAAIKSQLIQEGRL